MDEIREMTYGELVDVHSSKRLIVEALVVVFVVVITIVALIGCAPTSITIDKSAYEPMSVDTLCEQAYFDNSQARFDYEGKAVAMRGSVSVAHPDEAYFTLWCGANSPWSTVRIICRARNDAVVDTLRELPSQGSESIGQSVKVYGRIVSVDSSSCIIDVDELEI